MIDSFYTNVREMHEKYLSHIMRKPAFALC